MVIVAGGPLAEVGRRGLLGLSIQFFFGEKIRRCAISDGVTELKFVYSTFDMIVRVTNRDAPERVKPSLTNTKAFLLHAWVDWVSFAV